MLALDLLVALVRVSLVNARLPQLMNLASLEEHEGSERTLKLLERPSLRMTLRFSLVLVHFILVGAGLWQLSRLVTPLLGWHVLVFAAGAALLLTLIEVSVEGLALRNPETWALRMTGIARVIDVLFRP
ncbi:hypothetical protein FDZ74_07920, partial [bacterium]